MNIISVRRRTVTALIGSSELTGLRGWLNLPPTVGTCPGNAGVGSFHDDVCRRG